MNVRYTFPLQNMVNIAEPERDRANGRGASMATSPLIPSTLPPREGCACEGCDNPGCHFGGCQGRKPIVRRTVTNDPELLPLPPDLAV